MTTPNENAELIEALRYCAVLLCDQADVHADVASNMGEADETQKLLKGERMKWSEQARKHGGMLDAHADALSKPAALPWQPIATAPKDGLVTVFASKVIHKCFYDIKLHRWVTLGQESEGFYYHRIIIEPTHWLDITPPV